MDIPLRTVSRTTERLRLRQAVIAAHDLENSLADLRAVLDLPEPFNDPGVATFGLGNGVMPVGDTFLEVVSPARENTTAGRFLQRQGGDSGYMVIVQAEDLEQERARLESLGVRIVWQISLDNIATLHLHPADVGGAIVSIDAAEPPQSWAWAGAAWESKPRSRFVSEITGVEIHCADPIETQRRWCEVLDAEPASAGSGKTAGWRPSSDDQPQDSYAIALSRGTIRFTTPRKPGREGLRTIRFAAVDAQAALGVARERGLPCGDGAVEVCGVRLLLR